MKDMNKDNDYYEKMNRRIGAVMVAICAVVMSILFIFTQ